MSRQDGKITRKQEQHIVRPLLDTLRRHSPAFDQVQAAISDPRRMAALNAGADRLITQFLGETPSEAIEPRVWTPSRIIQVGMIKDERAMRKALKAAGRQIGSWSSDILPQVRYSLYTPQEPRDVKLVFVSNEDLGLTDEWIPLERTHTAGLKQGLELCEWEDGPHLAAQYKDQPYGEVLRMAMKPIVGSDGYSYLFSVLHDYIGLWLRADYGSPSYECHRSARLVFRCK